MNTMSRDIFVSVIAIIFAAASTGDAVAGELFKLLPSDGASLDYFGGRGLDIRNGVAVVGAPGEANVKAGYAYSFNASTGAELVKLTASNGAIGDLFGSRISIYGEQVLIGAPGTDNGAGSAYLFDLVTGGEVREFTASDRAVGDNFGRALSMSGTIAVIGSEGDDDNGMNSGSAYIFDVLTGNELAKLLPNDGATEDQFGYQVSVDAGIAAISSYQDDDNGLNSGSVYLFDTATGVQINKLLPNDGAAGDWFGNSVALDGNLLLVGAPSDDDNGADSGSAYLFDVTTGAQLMKLLPDDGAAGDIFGSSVAMHDGIAVIGAYLDDDLGGGAGSAYIFDVASGKQLGKLLPSDGATGDRFGFYVAIHNGQVLTGAGLNDDLGRDSGSAYIFTAVPEPKMLGLLLTACCVVYSTTWARRPQCVTN